MLNKKGDYRNILMSLILGLMILAISFGFIFNDYFTKESIDWEICRESLILRNNLPEKDVVADVVSTKSVLPLKCKTQSIDIDYEDTARAKKEISEIISSCWYMVGRGEYNVFPGKTLIFRHADTPCMICARVHLDKEVREFYSEEGNVIDIEESLGEQLEGYDSTVWEYLNPNKGAKAFMYFKNWSDEGFEIYYDKLFTLAGLPDDVEAFSFPKYLDSEKGDLFIVYAEPVTESSDIAAGRGVKPYMVLLQYDDFDKLSEPWIGYEAILQSKVCSSIETVPS